MKIEEIQKQLETEKVEFHDKCHDCGIPVDILCSINEDNEIVIEGGAVYNPKFGTPPTEHIILKCIECFGKDKTLRNFIPCEVYSRIVGYLRPVQQWNKGKQEEFKKRKEFVVEEIRLGDDKI